MKAEELKVEAGKAFTANPNINLLYGTNDGQFFTDWHNANNHSRDIGDRKVTEFVRDNVKEKVVVMQDMLDAIAEAKTLEVLKEIKLGNKPAQPVLDAYLKKKKELENS